MAVMVLLAVVTVLGLVISTGYRAEIDHQLEQVLIDRFRLADELAEMRARPPALVDRIEAGPVWARLELTDGRVLGRLDETLSSGEKVKLREGKLHPEGQYQGAHLTLGVDTGMVEEFQFRLVRLLIIASTVALVVAFVVLQVAARVALAPLTTMARLAREISKGGRGRRLAPSRTDSEIGRVAVEFDAMLDSLEGAETAAREAEERTRRFVADAVHELRTPISAIRAVSEAVLAQPSDEEREDLQRLLVLMVAEVQRAGRLVEDLHDMARIEAGEAELCKQICDVGLLAGEQADRVRLLYPDIEIVAVAPTVTIYADPIRISQILANLLDNACRATPRGGRVTVAAALRSVDVEVTVTDTGPGVPEAERERVFDRLVRLDWARDRGSGGSGLGLTIARGLARAHGGDLTCDEPDTNIGALFRLRLPAVE